jgi:hypothetical protein
MKKCLPILAAILLSACTAAPTPTPTATATYTPAASPTPTLTPTVTPDPDMPEGATGKNRAGQWTRSEFVWSDEVARWMRPLNKKPIPLLDLVKSENDYGIPDQMWLFVDIAENVSGAERLGELTHEPYLTRIEGPHFAGMFLGFLDNVNDVNDIEAGKVSIAFTTSEGPQNWKLGPNTSVCTHIIDPDDAGGEAFHEWSDPYGTHFFSRFFTDEEGNLHSYAASTIPLNQLNQEQIYEMMLIAPGSVLNKPDQTSIYYNEVTSALAVFAHNDSHPYFEIKPR